jgi:Right handed beta helix region
MKTQNLTFKLSLSLFALLLCSVAAQAQLVFYVGTTGNDGNPCTRTAPCRTMQRGVNVTPAGGELQVLDSGGYGPSVSITKSITISANGITANVLQTNAASPAISINDAGATVVLRGLTVSGAGTGQRGIFIDEAAAVYIERCQIERFAGEGILLDLADTRLFITNTTSRSNGGDGLRVNGTGAGFDETVVIDNSHFVNNGDDGIDIEGSETSITRVVAANNFSDGIEQGGGRLTATWTTTAQNGASGFAVFSTGEMTLEYCMARGNTTNGLNVLGPTDTGRISNSVFTNNAVGINMVGSLETRANNTVQGNGTSTTGAGATSAIPGI